MERVMCGAGRLLDHFHRLYQRVLAALFHDLPTERPLNIIRLRQMITFDLMNGYIRVQDLEVLVSPGQKHGVLGTPGSEVRKGLLKRKAVRKIRVRYLSETGDLSMHMRVVLGLHHNFECVNLTIQA